MRKFYANINMLSGKFSKCSPDVKCILYKVFLFLVKKNGVALIRSFRSCGKVK